MRSGFFSKYSKPLVIATSILVQAGIQVFTRQSNEDTNSSPKKEKNSSGNFSFYQEKPSTTKNLPESQASATQDLNSNAKPKPGK